MILTDQKSELIAHNINLHTLENIGRICYNSMDKKTDTSYLTFFKNLLKNKHESIIEHCSVTFLFKTNRAIGNELVRHRLASYTQSSTRYIKYDKNETEFIIPSNLKDNIIIKHLKDIQIEDEDDLNYKLKQIYFKYGCDSKNKENIKAEIFAFSSMHSEEYYKQWLNLDAQDQENARDILPLSLASNLVMTCNLREFMHIYKLRALGTTGRPHKHIKELIDSAMQQFFINENENSDAQIFFKAAIELAKNELH